MYEKEFQLKSRPFQAGSRAEFWCHTGNSAQSVEQVCRTLTRGSGISVLIGGAGTGKTLALEIIARRFAERNPEVVQIACSRLDKRRDVLQRILFELNLPCRDLSESDLRLTVVQHFRSICGQHGREVLLLVDEAHNLDVELIDELRIVVESAAKNTGKCHLVLAGTSRLEDHLNHTNLDTFNQRIACRAYLTAMDRKETTEYVSQHMVRAGAGKREFFSPEALRELARVTGGIPRLVNQVCDQCLIVCAGSGAHSVDQNMVTDAWCDIQNLPRQTVDSAAKKTVQTGNRHVSASPSSSAVEFGSLDDDDDDNGEASDGSGQEWISKAPTATETAAPTIQPDQTVDSGASFEHDFSAVSAGNVSQATDGNPFEEMFSVEEPVQSQKQREGSTAKPRPVVKQTKKHSSDQQKPETYTQIDASTMADFPPYENVLETGFNELPYAQLDTGLTTNPICEDPAMDEMDTIPIQSLTASVERAEPLPRTEKNGNTDDRDMLISGDATIYEPTGTTADSESKNENGSPKPTATLKGPHKSGAVRMEYHQLFAQLRSEAS